MKPENLIMLCISIVHAGGLAGGIHPEDSQDHAIGFVRMLAEEIAAAGEAADPNQLKPGEFREV